MAHDITDIVGSDANLWIALLVNMRLQLNELSLTLYRIREHCMIMLGAVLVMKFKADITDFGSLGLAF